MAIESLPVAGIGLAVVSAALLALGNELQSRGVTKVSALSGGRDRDATGAGAHDGAGSTGLGGRQFKRLVLNRTWLLGTLFLVLSVLVQLGSLTLAPLIVVQPVGVVALVFAALLTALLTRRRPGRRVVRAILVCVVGVAVFVTVAALVAHQSPIDDGQLIAILIVLGVVLAAIVTGLVLSRRRRIPPIFFVLAGGLLTGFVATLGKTVILRVQTALSEEFEVNGTTVLTIACVLGIAVAGGLSMYFIQMAHTRNPPEVVVAGITVVDPFVAVVLGITILGEAAGAPLWSILAFVVAGATAVGGVFLLSAVTEEKPAPKTSGDQG